ncbi:hypothetical protein IJX73_01560 [bacterium]|nr:hypothetical protein [bacterium]
MEAVVMNEIQKSIDVFEKYGIKTSVNKDNLIIISHYNQPKGTTFAELGIDEDELIKHVVACSGIFDTRKSKLTTFPLEVSQEIRMDEATQITQMPNLKAVGKFIVNSKLKKLPKLKAVSSISLVNSNINSLPKLKEAGILIAQNSKLKDLENLENVGNLCIIDCPLEELKSLKTGKDIFICSSDENQKINLKALNKLETVEKIFIANATLKTLPKLKSAKKVALYNCEIKNIKSTICPEIEIKNHISDDELSNKFDTFTDWYNSDILNQSLDLLGSVVNQIKK